MKRNIALAERIFFYKTITVDPSLYQGCGGGGEGERHLWRQGLLAVPGGGGERNSPPPPKSF